MTKNLIFLVLVLGTLTTLIPISEGNQLVSAIVTKLLSLHQSGPVNFLGHPCHYRVKPRISKFQLKYDGKFWCPGFASFSGRATRKSRSGAAEHAIQDFAQKAVASNLLSQSEVDKWIAG
ncbi:Anti-lipopolysaccharide factor [Armadillidium nasatum]|uniref:Anti-lipopolysaccharide factor n=1 Tax=Armadillidium nasatum TaxID=96803 RepID=A0A5N5SRG1_9CRUS|nr:Anti-lipopolysaccharide factor [Armadillidium nasatum]